MPAAEPLHANPHGALAIAAAARVQPALTAEFPAATTRLPPAALVLFARMRGVASAPTVHAHLEVIFTVFEGEMV